MLLKKIAIVNTILKIDIKIYPTAMAYEKNFMEWFHSVGYDGHMYLVCALCDVTI